MQPTAKLRMTTQRQVLLDELKHLKIHPTAGELCQIVRRRLPRISLGTVYRNLDVFSRTGIIQKLDVAGLEMRFDGDTSDHYHLRCLGCGRVVDVELEPIAGLEATCQKQSDFKVLGHRLEFMGLCPGCQESRQAAN